MTTAELQQAYGVAWGEACPACGVQPGEACVRDFATPAHPLGVAMDEPHGERVEAAEYRASVDAGMGGSAVHVASAEQIRDAAEGLV